MKVRNVRLGIVFAGFTLVAAPVLAQSPKEGGSPAAGGGDRSSGGGGPANAGGGATAVSSSSGGGADSSSSGGGFGSMRNSASASDPSFGVRGLRETAPAHRAGYSASASNSDSGQKATPRTATASGGNSGSGERAVPRGAAASGSGDSGGNNGARTRAGSGDRNNESGAREVPNWSRPRGDSPQTGTAVPRVGPPPDLNGNHGRYYDPYYYGYGGYYGGFGYSYAPFGYGFGYGYYPYSFGMGYGLYSGFGWNPYFGDPFGSYYGEDYGGGGGYGGYSSGIYNTRDQGNLKLKVKPRNAKVYVDGYYVGLVDEFDGAFQKLALNGGRHKVEVRADGFETAEFDVLITPDQTVTFQGDLKRIQ